MLVMASTLGYFDIYRTANLPLNLTQAQRDLFVLTRTDELTSPKAGPIHTEWEQLLEKQGGG
jgi:6-phosphogluconate dehydrogenase